MQDSHDDIAGKEWLFGSLMLVHTSQSEGKKMPNAALDF